MSGRRNIFNNLCVIYCPIVSVNRLCNNNRFTRFRKKICFLRIYNLFFFLFDKNVCLLIFFFRDTRIDFVNSSDSLHSPGSSFAIVRNCGCKTRVQVSTRERARA